MTTTDRSQRAYEAIRNASHWYEYYKDGKEVSVLQSYRAMCRLVKIYGIAARYNLLTTGEISMAIRAGIDWYWNEDDTHYEYAPKELTR